MKGEAIMFHTPDWLFVQDYEDALKAGDLKSSILCLVHWRNYISLQEILEELEPYFPLKGRALIWDEAHPDTIFWEGVSPALADAIHALIREKEIAVYYTGWFRWRHAEIMRLHPKPCATAEDFSR